MGRGVKGIDFYLLRAPRLPLATLDALNSSVTTELLDEYFRRLFSDGELVDAIRIASDDLGGQLDSWLKAPTSRLPQKVGLSLFKYVLRMASRATPFGKFSGISLGAFTEHSGIGLSGKFLPNVRFDMGFLGHISKTLLADDAIRYTSNYKVNNSLYLQGDHYRFIEWKDVDGKRSFQWSRVSKNPILQSVLQFAKVPVSFRQLVAHISGLGAPESSAMEYLDLLINEQLLVSDLEPAIIGGNPFNTIHAKVKSAVQDSSLGAALTRLESRVKQAMDGKIPASAIKSELGVLENGWKGKDVVQVDTRIETVSNELHRNVRDAIIEEIEELVPLNYAPPPKQLLAFAQRFSSRYGGQEVPLMEALDQDRGIGYGERAGQYLDVHPLIKGLGLTVDKRMDHLHNQIRGAVYLKHWESGGFSPEQPEVFVSEFLPSLNSTIHLGDLPVTGFVFGELMAKDFNAINRGDFRFNLLSCSGPSALPLMTRFSHLDPRLESKLRDCASLEDSRCGDALIAEIVHLPEDRMGNVMQRPRLREYEIPFLGNSTVSDAYQIPLTDLYVSVKDGKVWLRSGRLNKFVIPRLSCAHNFRYGVTAYQFLCDLQYQSNALDISWDWGELKKLPYLPRVSHKHLILSRAQWQIPKGALESMQSDTDDALVDRLVTLFKLPEIVVLAEADNELILNLTNPFARKILVDRVKKGNVKLMECLLDLGSPVSDSDGLHYANELIIPFYTGSEVQGTPDLGDGLQGRLVRSFPPGSRWLFAKIYCGERDSDYLLADQIARIVLTLKQRKLIEKWFFIRYRDPEPHIRLRFQIKEGLPESVFAQLMEVTAENLDSLVRSGVIHRFVYDTYEREVERYGEDTMETCEEIFRIDSEYILQAIADFLRPDGHHTCWMYAVSGVDDMLSAFGADDQEKLRIVDTWFDAFAIEFKLDKETKKKMGNRYREFRPKLESVLNGDADIGGLSDELRQIRISCLVDAFIPFNGLQREKAVSILANLCHMYLNRIFFSNQRENEMVVYHFLGKFYLARIKKDGAVGPQATGACLC